MNVQLKEEITGKINGIHLRVLTDYNYDEENSSFCD